ncbi:hypothetical protein [Pararhodobacter sp.]|uniref:hypothetical protein n=1 Tax=Pararhodobacter sp. TaxID=2127056 RepID=UPI002AFF1B5B|nr:hypothetical protein [Pararhodobacter sp.]
MNDAASGALILVGNAHFQDARWWTLVAAWLFGKHQRLQHLGYNARISFWRGTPYLLTFNEVE